MTVMIMRVLKLNSSVTKSSFSDSSDISDWAKDAISDALSNGIISGYENNTFKPQGTATRAEAVTVIVNALK